MPVLPVTVLSGFLGAGKTTLVNHLLRHPGGKRFAVLVNDLAEVNVDAMKLKAGRTRVCREALNQRSLLRPDARGVNGTSTSTTTAAERVDGFVELHNGCICCTLREDFIREVSRLARAGSFDALLVEATGVAEPLPVAMAFDMADPEGQMLGSIARIDSMVTVVDAYNFLTDWEKAEELSQLGLAIDSLDNRTIADLLAEQVEYANQIVINKSDLVSAEQLRQLEGLLGCLNPEARVTSTMFGTVDPETFLNTGLFAIGEISPSTESTRAQAESPEPTLDEGTAGSDCEAHDAARRPSPTEGSATEQPLHEQLGITSFVYRARRPFHPERLWTCLAEAWPGVLRSKGLFWLATRMNDSGLWSQAGKACSHQSAGRWWSSLPEDHLPDDEGLRQSILAEFRGPFGDRRQEIVIIGRSLDRRAIRSQLDACLLDASEMRLGPMGWRQLPDPFPVWESDVEDETEIVVPPIGRETPSA